MAPIGSDVIRSVSVHATAKDSKAQGSGVGTRSGPLQTIAPPLLTGGEDGKPFNPVRGLVPQGKASILCMCILCYSVRALHIRKMHIQKGVAMRKTANLTVRIEPGLKQRASEAAQYMGMSLGAVVEMAFRSVIGQAQRKRALERAEDQTMETAIERQRYLQSAAAAAGSIQGDVQGELLSRQQRRALERTKGKGRT